MARQRGLFKLSGTIGGINYYIAKGVPLARIAGGGFNGDAIRTKPSMARVRENSSEFANCSRAKKAFRVALLPLFNPPKSSLLHQRWMSRFMALKDLDGVAVRGQRRVAQGLETAKGKRLLREFVFVPENKAVGFVLNSSSFDWGSQTLTVGNLNLRDVVFPKSATHLALHFGVLDFDFNTLEGALYPAPVMFLEKDSLVPSFTLTPETLAVPSATGLAVLGVSYCEVIEDEVYGFKGLRNFGCKIVSIL